MMNQMLKPLPAPDSDSMPFWDGCRDHKLMLQRCTECGRFRFPPHRFCHRCQSEESEWIEASGKGEVFSWIVVVHPVPREVYAGEVPYVVALIDLEEGVRMASNIVDCDPHAVEAGMPVEVIFRPARDGIVLPLFRPAKA
jgi:uncharacterized OB-fold protein